MKTNGYGAEVGAGKWEKLLVAVVAIAMLAVCTVAVSPVDAAGLGDSIAVDADAETVDDDGFLALATEGVITLQKDYIVSEPIVPTQSLTIDLNGHVIDAQSHIFVNMSQLTNQNTLTIRDTSSDESGAIKNSSSSGALFNLYGKDTNGGSLTIESGTFYSDYVIVFYSPIGEVLDAKLTISGGTFLTEGVYSAVWLGNAGIKEVSISNATFESSGNAIGLYLGSNTSASITNCRISSENNTAIEIKSGEVAITGCTVKSGVYEVSNDVNSNGSGGAAATININNGYCKSTGSSGVSVSISNSDVTTSSTADGATPIIVIADGNNYPISVSWQNHDVSDVTVGYNDSSTSLITFNGSSLANSADTLKRALTKGGAIELTEDITTSEYSPFFVSSSTTIDGNGHSVTSTNNEANARVFTISGNEANYAIASGSTVTFNDIRVVGPTVVNYTRGITVHYTSNLTLNINEGYVSAGSYAINIGGDNTGLTLNVTESTATGWCAFQTHSLVTKANFKNCELIGTNTQQNPASNSFSTIVINKDAPNASEASGNIVFEGCNITAVMTTQAGQSAIDMRSEKASVITLKDCDVDVSKTTYPMFIIADTNEILIEGTLNFKGTGLIYGGGLSGGFINMDIGDVLQFSIGSGYSGTILGPDGNSLVLDSFEAVELTTITAGSLSISGSWSGEMIVSGEDVTITGKQSADTKIIVKPQEDGSPSNVTWEDFEQNGAKIEYQDLKGNEAEPSEVANQTYENATFDDEMHTGTSYSVSVQVSGGNGTVSGVPETVAEGGSFIFSFSSASGYEIGDVVISDTSSFVVSGTTFGTVTISGVTGPVNVVVTFVESAISNVPVDDDDDLPPFIPTQPEQDDDTTTIVACAAAAVVAALMAVFLIMEYRKR